MDGLYRPSQALGYTDSLGHLSAADKAREQTRKTPEISQQGAVDAVEKDPKQREEGEGNPNKHKKEKDGLYEEELMETLTRQFHIQFQAGVVYRFIYNEAADRIELKDTSSQQILLSLTPDQFIQVTESLNNPSGIITDRVG